MIALLKSCPFVAVAWFTAIGIVFGQPATTVAQKNTVVESTHLMVAVSKSGKTVYAFSDYTGQWAKVTVESGEKEAIIPVVGEEVASFVVGTKAYAFSGRLGKWMVADLQAKGIPVVSPTRVRIDVQSKIYVVSASSKQWAVIDLSKD